MRTLLSRIVSHHKRGQTRLDLLIDSGDIGVDAVDPAKHVREQESVMVGEMPVERSTQLIFVALPG